MKTILLICDGMDEAPLDALGGLNPREYVSAEGFLALFRRGISGKLHTIPPGFQSGSEVAILSILGYSPEELPPGRAALEAQGSGVNFPVGSMAFRCNFIRYGKGGEIDPSVTLSPQRRRVLLDSLADLGIVYGKGDVGLVAVPPEEGIYTGVSPYSASGIKGGTALPHVARKAAAILSRHRLGGLTDGPDGIWIWSGSPVERLRPFPVPASMIAAVPLVKGIGYATGMRVMDVPGATGTCDTDYSSKTAAALTALEHSDMVIIHVEACDEASHRKSIPDKIRAIRSIDSKIIKPLLSLVEAGDIALAVLSDHHTSSLTGSHTSAPVDFALLAPGTHPEKLSQALSGDQFISLLRSL